jgi:hypothetical protein
MLKTLSNPMSFAAAAILFAVASFATPSAGVIGSGDRIAPIEMKSSGTLPPDPWQVPPAMVPASRVLECVQAPGRKK